MLAHYLIMMMTMEREEMPKTNSQFKSKTSEAQLKKGIDVAGISKRLKNVGVQLPSSAQGLLSVPSTLRFKNSDFQVQPRDTNLHHLLGRILPITRGHAPNDTSLPSWRGECHRSRVKRGRPWEYGVHENVNRCLKVLGEVNIHIVVMLL